MVPQVDFDIVDSILRVLEGWELGNDGLYRKYWPYINILKKSKKFKILFWSRESKKPIFRIFPDFFTKNRGNRFYGISGNRNLSAL